MANLYAKTAGGNWSAAGTWSATSSAGADSAGPPLATDATIFDSGASGTVTVNTTTCVAKSVTVNATTAGTLAFTAAQKLTVSGNVTFVSTFNLTGTGNLTVNAAATLTSGGLTFPGSLTLSVTNTKTLADNWVITGLVNTANTQTLNQTTTQSLTCNGGLTMDGQMSGTAGVVIGGSAGVLTGTAALSNNLTFNCTSASFAAGVFAYGAGTMTYTAGTITTTGSTLSITGAATLNTAGITWDTIQSSNVSVVLASNLACSTLKNSVVLGGTALGFSGAFNITCDTLQLDSIGIARTFTFPAGQNVTVTTNLYLVGEPRLAFLVNSSTASTAFNLIYQGTAANCQVAFAQFTDVDASGSSQAIYNYNGSTLTRTTNIYNVDQRHIGGIFIQ